MWGPGGWCAVLVVPVSFAWQYRRYIGGSPVQEEATEVCTECWLCAVGSLFTNVQVIE